MNISKEVEIIVTDTIELASQMNHEYVTPEHFLYILTFHNKFKEVFEECGGNIQILQDSLKQFLEDNIPVCKQEPEMTEGFQELLLLAQKKVVSCGKKELELPHMISGILELEECYAKYFIEVQGVTKAELLRGLNAAEEIEPDKDAEKEGTKEDIKNWLKYVECLNDTAENENPLIGREQELERTIQVLCRKDKNNPLHIGEPGVGKTAVTIGLARMLKEDRVPDILKGAKIYSVDLGSMLAGTQYRGDFEKRFKEVMDGIAKEEKPIVYFDEIHNIVGAGAVNGSSFDASNMLKSYLTNGAVRFIGATTYEEYKKYFSKSKSLVRRFQNIDIKEPKEAEAIWILEGLKESYEKFHKVKYGKGVLEYAVSLSSRFINERYLPDKAIDLIDEAGAYRELHPTDKKTQMVTKDLIDDVLSKICNIPKQMLKNEEVSKLASLEKKLSSQIFGQVEAVKETANTVKFSKAGLADEQKPLASLLFVGPTGVGKTELIKVLAKELGVKLIRFDMSEYAEKHAVAKLVGAPAGYVGYEEGGLLTEEIRKNPNSILLLDEIEKAHSDIYNILLQVMDYATLTDNQGRKADFRNVIIVMTSNAGVRDAGKELIGFGDRNQTESAIMEEINRIFQPEFRNRLNRIILFCSMDEKMAVLVTKKKLEELAQKLSAKNVKITFTKEAVSYVKEKGISKEYGAREIDRVINNEIKPLLVEDLLFGKLKKGGNCNLDWKENKLILQVD